MAWAWEGRQYMTQGVLSGGVTIFSRTHPWAWTVLALLLVVVKAIAFRWVFPAGRMRGLGAMLVASGVTLFCGTWLELNVYSLAYVSWFYGVPSLDFWICLAIAMVTCLPLQWWAERSWWQGKGAKIKLYDGWLVFRSAAIVVVLSWLSHRLIGWNDEEWFWRLLFAFPALGWQLYVTCGIEMDLIGRMLKREKREVLPAVWRANASAWLVLLLVVTAILLWHQNWPYNERIWNIFRPS